MPYEAFIVSIATWELGIVLGSLVGLALLYLASVCDPVVMQEFA